MNENIFPANTVLWMKTATEDTLSGVFGMKLLNTFKLAYSKYIAENGDVENGLNFQIFIWKTLQDISASAPDDIPLIATKIITQIRFLWRLEKSFHLKIVLSIVMPEKATDNELLKFDNFLRMRYLLSTAHKDYRMIHKAIIDETISSFDLKFNTNPPIIIKNKQGKEDDENKK